MDASRARVRLNDQFRDEKQHIGTTFSTLAFSTITFGAISTDNS